MNGPNGRAMPGWVRSVAYLVGMLGFPVVVAGYLLAQSGGLIASPITETRDATAEVRSLLVTHLEHEQQRTRLLRAICRHTAKTATDLEDCDPREPWRTRRDTP